MGVGGLHLGGGREGRRGGGDRYASTSDPYARPPPDYYTSACLTQYRTKVPVVDMGAVDMVSYPPLHGGLGASNGYGKANSYGDKCGPPSQPPSPPLTRSI